LIKIGNIYIPRYSGNWMYILDKNFVLFEQKNEKHVVLTLLEVARRGAKLGMLAPMLVQFEQQIDIELAR
jgi:hypothetical protein